MIWNFRKLNKEEKQILLSLIAIEKVTSLKIHKIFNDYELLDIKFFDRDKFKEYFSNGADEVYEKFVKNLDFNFEVYFSFYNVEYLFCDDEYYPRELFRLYDYPFVIFYRGNKDLLLFKRKISVVGSRNNTRYSEKSLEKIIPYLVENNFVITSGIALGVDTLAHNITITSKGYTIGVIAHGHNIIYPEKNIYLYKELEKNHLIISEYLPTSGIKKYKFLERNRLVASLSRGLLVTEAAKRSGTSRTISYALDVGSEVFCLPGRFGDEMSFSLNEYIKEGAILVNKLEDFKEVINF